MSEQVTRRDLLKVGGLALASTALPQAANASMTQPEPLRGRKLLDRGEPEVFTGDELKFIGMPVGGLFAGTLYLGGDGQLWNWDIFNQGGFGCVERATTQYMGETLHAGGGSNYVDPVRQQSPFQQRFFLTLEEAQSKTVRFGDIRFRGEYPVGKVSYLAADADCEMTLEAFSPFCPLDAESSSFPATTMTFTVKNTSARRQKLKLSYRLDNPVLVYSRTKRGDAVLKGEATAGGGVLFSAAKKELPASARPEILFEDWSSGTYNGWTATGTAFGGGPQEAAKLPSYMGQINGGTKYVVNSHQTRNGEDVVKADVHVGTLTSPAFAITRRHINLRMGGGSHKDKTCINLLVDGRVVRSLTGKDSNAMQWQTFSVAEYEGQKAVIQVVDQHSGGWGQISLGEVVFSDVASTFVPLEEAQDNGTFCVEVFGGADKPEVTNERGAVAKTLDLGPGESKEVTFVIAWHFPNCASSLPAKKHWYAKRWKDAKAVADELISGWKTLQATTRAWNKTWYDSTLPYWFLDRTFVNTSILATTTCFRLGDGRYWFWEGVGCCAGTCTHVWGYAQAIGRVFPEVEKYLRKEIDFGMAFRKDSGGIDYRAEFHQTVAVDGQASCILRAYREHQMSKDDSFLKSVWPQIKGAMKNLTDRDPNKDGILDGAQYNTLDTAWFGEISWISSLYIAALRACEAMALEMGEPAYAKECGEIARLGSDRLVKNLFNGEYFIHKVDPKHPEANNTNNGCHIDQIYGQSWAHQVGLPRVVPSSQAKTAMKSLFKYSFFEDIWEYRRRSRHIMGGRWYAAPKEPGLIMTTFPKGGDDQALGKGADAWAGMYFNECMSGFEYQAANCMLSEGLVNEGLTVVRAIHERYSASKRNPYNEIECSDHYGRAMASYGAYVSLTGFYCHGPKGIMKFNPKVGGSKHRFPFINQEGWGTWTKEGEVEKTDFAWKKGRLE